MNLTQKLFLEALKASLENKKITWDFSISDHIWKELFSLAELHKVLPLIFDAVNGCPAAEASDRQLFEAVRKRSISGMILQIQKTSQFLEICKELNENHIRVLVVKGLICRQLYPNPDLRFSSDEDLLVDTDSFLPTMELLRWKKLQPLRMPEDFWQRIHEFAGAEEIGFISWDKVTYIELHRRLFSESSEAYGSLNRYFDGIFENCICMEVQGVKVYTPEPGLHLFYLICHALKHFLHSGFGIRQVCDIVMFANVYGKEIDWQQLFLQCGEIHAQKFAAALFRIGKNYLNFDEEGAGYPTVWREIPVEETDLLLELFDSGIYGDSSMSRRHSSNMTLAAVEGRGEKSGNPVLKTLFPEAKKLEHQYNYLKKRPYLLPVAWGGRLLKYRRETAAEKNNRAVDAVRIGNQRIALMKKYGILDEDHGK